VVGKQFKKIWRKKKMERFVGFYDFNGESGFSRFSNEEDYCPWYVRAMMDRDTVHMTVEDLSDPEQYEFEENMFEKTISTDSVCFLLTPSVMRSLGYNPECLMTLKDYKVKSMNLIKAMAPVEIRNSTGLFRERIQKFLNENLTLIYQANSLDDAKSFIGEVLCFLGVDYTLEAVSEEDVVLYNTTYLPYVKVLKILGLEEEIRPNNSYYSKRIPEANLWDLKDFLEIKANFIAFAFYKSFKLVKDNPADRLWIELHNEAEKAISLVDRVLTRIPVISTVNKKKETWELNSHDFFYSQLKKKIVMLVEEIQPGLKNEFISFFIPEELQRIFDPRMVYRPWKKK
jgi:hypothetical protein